MVLSGQSTAILVPALALVTLSLCVWVALVTVRPRAMIAARMPWQAARHTADLTDLPGRARDVADNYNHLMEQPTVLWSTLLLWALAAQNLIKLLA